MTPSIFCLKILQKALWETASCNHRAIAQMVVLLHEITTLAAGKWKCCWHWPMAVAPIVAFVCLSHQWFSTTSQDKRRWRAWCPFIWTNLIERNSSISLSTWCIWRKMLLWAFLVEGKTYGINRCFIVEVNLEMGREVMYRIDEQLLEECKETQYSKGFRSIRSHDVNSCVDNSSVATQNFLFCSNHLCKCTFSVFLWGIGDKPDTYPWLQNRRE